MAKKKNLKLLNKNKKKFLKNVGLFLVVVIFYIITSFIIGLIILRAQLVGLSLGVTSYITLVLLASLFILPGILLSTLLFKATWSKIILISGIVIIVLSLLISSFLSLLLLVI